MNTPGSEDPSAAADAVGRYIRQQCDAVMAGEVTLRDGVDHVHETRVAIRRLRSTLRVFAPLFDASQAHELDLELAWFASLLGAVRDREVQRVVLAEALAALPPDLVLGPVGEEIDEQLRSEQQFHHDQLTQAMTGSRYRLLLTSLVSWAGGPPYAISVDDSELLVRRAKKAGRGATQRLSSALEETDEDVLATALHRARKAAKRARYSAELIEPIGPGGMRTTIRHFKAVQDTLGAHQDSVLAARLLRELAAEAGSTPDHNGFTYGVLYEQQVRAAEDAREAAAAL